MGAVGEDSFGVRVGRPTKGLRVWGGLDHQREEGEGRQAQVPNLQVYINHSFLHTFGHTFSVSARQVGQADQGAEGVGWS